MLHVSMGNHIRSHTVACEHLTSRYYTSTGTLNVDTSRALYARNTKLKVIVVPLYLTQNAVLVQYIIML